MLRARIGGITFDGNPPTPDNVYVIGPEGWVGWDEGVTVRRDEVPRPTRHGMIDTPGYLSGRYVEISGFISGLTDADTRHMAGRLTGLLADGSTGRLVVDTDTGTTWADVRLADQTTVTIMGSDPRVASFRVKLWAPNPRKYGEIHEFPGTPATVYQRGNFPAHPVIDVEGPVTAPYTVVSQGRTFTVTQSLTGGQTHRIVMETGRLYRDGVLQSGAVDGVGVFTVPVGGPVTVTGPASMTVLVTDTYV